MMLIRKDEKITTKFEAVNDEDAINTAYLDEKLKKINDKKTLLDKDYKEYKLHYNKQSVEEYLIQRAIKTTIQKLYHRGLFASFPNADKVLKELQFVVGRRTDLEETNDNDLIQCFCS